MAFYTGQYGAPLKSLDTSPITQGAAIQAQMYQNLGQQFGGVISKWFDKKEETKMVESMAENPIALQVVYGDQGTVPTDQKERIKDIRGIVRASGGPEAFIARMENAELKTQNKQLSDLTLSLKTQQLEANRIAMAEQAKQIEATDAFNRWAFTPQPGQLTTKGRELEAGLGRFAPSDVPGTAEFQALEASEPMGARPNIGAVALQSRMEQERGPAQARAAMPSNRFLQSATESDLSPGAMKKAYEFAQQKATQETARDTDRLSGVESREKVIQLINKPTGDLRKEFQALPSVKDFNKVNAAYNKIRNAFTAIKRLPDEKKAAADMAVIFSYMKILDPGSTVREGEYASAQNTTGISGKIRNWYNNAVDGQILNDEQRGAFQSVARDTAQAQFDDLNVQIDFYKSIANKKGIDASRVIPQEYLTIAVEGLPGLPSTGGGGGGGDGPVTTKSGFIIGEVESIKPVQPAPTAPPAQPQAPLTPAEKAIEQDIRRRLQAGQQPQEILLWYQQQGPDVYQQAIDAYEKLAQPAPR